MLPTTVTKKAVKATIAVGTWTYIMPHRLLLHGVGR